jgi:protein-S-isoprenylcysteine O-methyltransferase Ste14
VYCAHEAERSSEAPRITWIIVHVAQVATAFALLDRAAHMAIGRQVVLALFATALWFRTTYRASRILGSGFAWREAVLASGATGTYQIAFALLGASSDVPFGLLDDVAVVLYVCGASLSTLSEVARVRFTRRPGSAGRLYTCGPFAFVRYPRYAGDILWASGWALVTRAPAAGFVVAAHAALLAFVYVPALERRLAARHGAEYRAWAAGTKRLVPFVY